MAGNNDEKKKYTPTAAPELKAAPTVPIYDTTSWDNTSKGWAALGAYNDAKNALANQSPFAFSENDWLNSVKDSIKNYGKFSYDVNSDALYQQYAEQYARMGKMAMQDTMGQAAAMTGGYGNSYSTTAGNQAFQSYLQQLNDRVPELYQLALSQHNMGKEDLYNQYGLLLSEYEREYGQHSDEYQKLLDALNIASSDYYNGADMYHTEQSNKNSALNQEFNNYMDIWQENNTNAWEQAKWDESLNQYANDEIWREKEYELSERQLALQENTSKYKDDDPVDKDEQPEQASDYADWGATDWESYFAHIRNNEGSSAAQEELTRMTRAGLIPKNMVTYASIGARGSLGH